MKYPFKKNTIIHSFEFISKLLHFANLQQSICFKMLPFEGPHEMARLVRQHFKMWIGPLANYQLKCQPKIRFRVHLIISMKFT